MDFRYNLLVGQFLSEGAEHLCFVFSAQLGTSLFEDALLPAQVSVLERKWLRSHF